MKEEIAKRLCYRKRPIRELSKVMRRAEQQSKETGEDIEWYYCDYCGNYHTGHKKKQTLKPV